jgi:hypothetical protein
MPSVPATDRQKLILNYRYGISKSAAWDTYFAEEAANTPDWSFKYCAASAGRGLFTALAHGYVSSSGCVNNS